MWKVSYLVILCLLSSMIIDEIACGRIKATRSPHKATRRRRTKSPIKVTRPPGHTTQKKTQRLE
jgi:hypothetical protein